MSMRNGRRTMNRVIENVLFICVLAAGGYVAYKLIRDIFAGANRPAVTDAMVEQAWRNLVMDDFDDEFDSVDWEE